MAVVLLGRGKWVSGAGGGFMQNSSGIFAKLPTATISFVMSVRPSEWTNSAPNGRIFMKFDMCKLKKSVEKIQF
jgi:hypothetical protein